MVQLSQATWLGVGTLAFMAIVGMLHVAAARVRDNTMAHDLKIQAIALRVKHLVMIKAMGEYRDLAQLPEDLDGQLSYLREGVFPGSDEILEGEELPEEAIPIEAAEAEEAGEVSAAAA